ncbi:hypothetical protein BH09BAC5_BH09BAC5_06980 [soil metagenome]
MRTKKAIAPPVLSEDRIKLRLDHKTIITVRTKHAMEMWMEKYPGAVIVD